MESFVKRKEEYIKRSEKYQEIILDLMRDNKNRLIVSILLNPRNEKELEYANCYFNLRDAMLELVSNARLNNVDMIALEESIYVDSLSSMLVDSKAIDSEYVMSFNDNNYMGRDFELEARMIYEMLVILATNVKGLMVYLSNKGLINIDDMNSVERLKVIFNAPYDEIGSFDSASDKEIDDFILFAEYFQKLCSGSINKSR